MSSMENLLKVNREKKLEVAANKAVPDDYRRGHEIKGDEGTGATGPLTAEESSNLDERALLERAGLDPEVWQINSDVQHRQWDANVGAGEIKTLYYKKFDVRKRGAKAVGLDDLVKLLEGKPGIKPPVMRGVQDMVDHVFHYATGDFQMGKSDGDGSEGIIERIVKSTKAAANEYVLYFQPRGVKNVHISFLGDCIEGLVSQGGRNVTRNDLTLTEQILLVQRIMLLSVDAFVDAGAEKITVVSIPGNHDETSRQFGTRYDDSFATHALVTVADAMRMNAERYSHVETFIPKKDSLTVTMKVGDTIITHAHGHQWRPAQHWKWWQGNSFEKGADIGQADLLLCGHSHHFQVDTQGSRTFIMTPSQESESTWYKNATGTHGAPGAVIFTTKGGKARNLSVV